MSAPKVLFVCVENSCRSQMAEGFARALGSSRIEAFSSGSKPSGVVNPRATEFMKEAGIDISKQSSKGLDALPPGEWDALVTMGCGDACPQLPAKRRLHWALPDPKNLSDDEFRRIRDEIRDRVAVLVTELIAAAPKPYPSYGAPEPD